MSSDDQHLINDLQGRIERENKYIQGAMQMRASTDNPSIQAQADNTIREGRRNIGYFQSRLNELQMRRMSLDPRNQAAQSAENGSRTPGVTGYRGGASSLDPYAAQSGFGQETPDYGEGGYSDIKTQRPGPMRAPFSSGPPGAPRSKATYSRLDLIKYDTPHLGPKIQLMLSQLEFKLSVEKQYKDGIEKIMGSYNIDGDRKIRKEAQGRRIESVQKIELLKRALKRYEDLHVDMESTSEPNDDDSLNAHSLRKPLTGILSLRVHAVSDISHTQSTSRFGSSRAPETFVIMKVEDDFKGRTKATRTDRWTDELHEVDIDKGNEIELTVYDKSGSDHPVPVGMLWVRISDIADEMRRKKIETELQSQGWVSADKTIDDSRMQARPDLQFNPPPSAQQSGMAPAGAMFPSGGANAPQMGPVFIDAWFQLEPVGRIQLSMSFAKQTRERRHFDAGLNRKGAIRQRKEDIHELYGHKFVSQQFYNIMRCALCGELLKYATGMQCTDCRYMCHEKCYPSVVTKCISKSNAESDPDEAKINHRIPHRFEPWGNIAANWCCHCGYLLPLGRKNCRRCRECKLTAHSHCTHLVPDFCGMPMKDANTILLELKNAIGKRRTMPGTPSLRPNPPGKGRSQPSRGPPSYNDSGTMGSETTIIEDDIPSASSSLTIRPASGASLGAATHAYSSGSPTSSSAKETQRRPVGARNDSSSTALAAAAAANALANKQAGRNDSSSDVRPSYQRSTSSQVAATSAPSQPSVHPTYDPRAYAEVERQQRMPPPQQQQQQQQPAAQVAASYTPPVPTPTSSAPAPTPAHQVALGPASTFNEQPRTVMPAKPQGSGRRIGLDHFNFLAVLGKGNFGKVMLAETKSTKQLYAIKVLKKEFIIEHDEVESTRSERDVFIIANRARHPFLLNLHACFQTETRVYFVMEYVSGGDLMWHIQRGSFGTRRAQFYAAEVCLALKYFHENGVVYRDLKLDNILLTLDGHIKIADYGLCKKDMYYGSSTRTFCGTPEFMAPEILLDKPYGRAVDWWAFGVLIYQMLLQQSPFRGEDEDEIYDAILSDEPLYPIHMPRDSVSILQKLLTREPDHRLGSGPTDAQEIMSHAFFRNINWDDIQANRVPAPYLPQIKSATDTSNFDSEFTSVTPGLTPVQSVLSQKDQEEFRGFSYSADFV